MQSKWQGALAALALVGTAQACSLFTDFPEIESNATGDAGVAVTATGAGGATTGSSMGQGGAGGSMESGGGGGATPTPSTFWVGTHRGTTTVSIAAANVPEPVLLPNPVLSDCEEACADCIPSETTSNSCSLLRDETITTLESPPPSNGVMSVVDGAEFGTTVAAPSTTSLTMGGPSLGQWGFVLDGAGRGRLLAGCEPNGPAGAEIFVTATTAVPAHDGTPGLLVIAGGTEARELRIAPLDATDPCATGDVVFTLPQAHPNAVPFLVALGPDLNVEWSDVLTATDPTQVTTPLYYSDVTSTPDGHVAAVGIWRGKLNSTLDALALTAQLTDTNPEYFAAVIGPKRSVKFNRLGVSVSASQTPSTGLTGLDASVDAVRISETRVELWFGLRGLDPTFPPVTGCPSTRGVLRSFGFAYSASEEPSNFLDTATIAFPCTGSGSDLKWTQIDRLAVERSEQDGKAENVIVAGRFAGNSIPVGDPPSSTTFVGAPEGDGFIAAYDRNVLSTHNQVSAPPALWARKLSELAPGISTPAHRPKVTALDTLGAAVVFAARAPARGSLAVLASATDESELSTESWCPNATSTSAALAVFGSLRGENGLIQGARLAGIPQQSGSSTSEGAALVAKTGGVDFAVMTSATARFECGALPDGPGSRYRLGSWDFQ
jgi:hypothetical protein